jgi:hypothetical protein
MIVPNQGRGAPMSKDKENPRIVLDENVQEQSKDEERAKTAYKAEPGHMPPQQIRKTLIKRSNR